MKYCSNCATPIAFGTVENEHIPRYHCTNCATIHYVNPKIIVACLPIWDNKVMLCRRGIEPRLGFWNIPGGFMENKESIQEGALREMLEETGCEGTIVGVHSVFTVLPVDQVHTCFLVEMTHFDYTLTPESTEIQLFEEKDIPWKDIAFISNTFALKRYFEDQRLGIQRTHMGQYPQYPNTP